jgi:hypothetical protein
MGLSAFDRYSPGHFLGGFAAGMITPEGLAIPSFIIFNGVHLLMECHENNCHPYYLHRETLINHIGDIILFMIGWFVGYMWLSTKISCTAKVWLTATFILATTSDIMFEYVYFKHQEIYVKLFSVPDSFCALVAVWLVLTDLGLSNTTKFLVIAVVIGFLLWAVINNDHAFSVLEESGDCKRTKYTPEITSNVKDV